MSLHIDCNVIQEVFNLSPSTHTIKFLFLEIALLQSPTPIRVVAWINHFFPIVAGTSAEKEGDGRQVVTPTVVPVPPTFNLLSEVASQLRATTLT